MFCVAGIWRAASLMRILLGGLSYRDHFRPVGRWSHQAQARGAKKRIYCSTVSEIKFGTDGWRGEFAEDFTQENVRKVAHAMARYVVRGERPERGVLVGYDTRFGSEVFARVAAETVAATGTPVWLAEEACPTPAVSLLVRQRGAAGGIQITASHNPYRWNGIKYKASYGSSASSAIVAQIETELATVLRDGVPPLPRRQELIHSLEIHEPY